MSESEISTLHITPSPLLNESDNDSEINGEVNVRTLMQFLLGSRSAILSLASNRETLWLGLMLVISAGLVREFGRSNWLVKPWLVLIPLVASVLLSLVLFPVFELVARQRGASGQHYWSRYRVFLGLFWMTAPLAWVYALPTERLLSPDNAAIINLWFLGIVSLWRVALVSRIFGVLFVPRVNEVVFTGALFVVLLVVDTLALCNFGGNRFVMMVGDSSDAPVAEFVIIHVMSAVAVLGVVTWPLWLVGTLAVALREGTPWSWTVTSTSSTRPVSRGLRTLVAASIAVWFVLLPLTPVPSTRFDRVEQPDQNMQSTDAMRDSAIR